MVVNVFNCLFVLDSEKNSNIRKNDLKTIKVLVKRDSTLPYIEYNGKNMKNSIREELTKIINNDIFHLEQVYTNESNNGVDVIYLSITNKNNIKLLESGYRLYEFKIVNNNQIMFNKESYNYNTLEVINNKNIEYIHNIEVNDLSLEKTLLYLLISYKKIRNNIDNTDILFKFLSDEFTLEDVRIVYELIKDVNVDKSNFRKKIIKYCEKIDKVNDEKNGFRPSSKYKFKPLEGDAWL